MRFFKTSFNLSFMISLRINGKNLLVIGNFITNTLTLLIALYFFRDFKISKLEWVTLFGFIGLWLFIRHWSMIFHYELSENFNDRLLYHLKTYSVYIILVSVFHSVFDIPITNKKQLFALVVGYPIAGFTFRHFLYRARNKFSNLTIGVKRVVLVAGVGNVAKSVEDQFISRYFSRYVVKGYIDCNSKDEMAIQKSKVVGHIDNIKDYLRDNEVDEIVIALHPRHTKKIQKILASADYHGVRVKYLLDYEKIFGSNYKIQRFGQFNALNIRQLPMDSTFSKVVKNVFDKVFATIALSLLAPVFLGVAILIKMDSPGPIIYSPIRIGKGCRAFRVYKFRSMRESDAASGGKLSTQKNDPRITKLGKFLRKYSIDELPQLLNVLKGDMSIVGPRPHRKFLNQQFQESVYKYMVRHYVKPGITGWAQVNGWRGPTDTEEQKQQRTSHDLWYIENWSIWLDFKIIFLTVFGKKTHKSAF